MESHSNLSPVSLPLRRHPRARPEDDEAGCADDGSSGRARGWRQRL